MTQLLIPVLRGGSGLKVTTGEPRSVQNRLSMWCNTPQTIKRTQFPMQSRHGWKEWLLGVDTNRVVLSGLWIGLGRRRNRDHGHVVIASRARELAGILAFNGDAGTRETDEGVLQRSGNSRARNRLGRTEGKGARKKGNNVSPDVLAEDGEGGGLPPFFAVARFRKSSYLGGTRPKWGRRANPISRCFSRKEGEIRRRLGCSCLRL